MDIQNFITDYNKYITKIDLMNKYNLTDYMYNQTLKQYNLNRGKCHKSLRLFNISNNNLSNLNNTNTITHIPIENSYKIEKILKPPSTISLTNKDTIIYDNRVVKHKMPKNTTVNVIKHKKENQNTNDEYDDIMKNAMSILNDTKKTLKNKDIM